MNQLAILNPIKQLALPSGQVDVRQLPFLRAIEFFKKLGVVAGQLFDDKGRFQLITPTVEPTGEKGFIVNPDVLEKVVSSSGELMEFLILNSTVGKDKAWVEKLSLAEGLSILQAAIELNLSKEVLALGNGLAVFIKETFTMGKTATVKVLEKPSTS